MGLNAGIQIAASVLKDRIPKEGTLDDRLRWAMRDVLAPNSASAFMCSTDDDMFKGAIGGVLLQCSEEERERIRTSLHNLNVLAAMLSGVPVDVGAIKDAAEENALPLLGIWNEVKNEMKR